MGRHTSGSTRRTASVRGVPLVGRPRGAEGLPRHGGLSGGCGLRSSEPGRRHGAGAFTGFALLAGAVFGTAGLQSAGPAEPPALAEPPAVLPPGAGAVADLSSVLPSALPIVSGLPSSGLPSSDLPTPGAAPASRPGRS